MAEPQGFEDAVIERILETLDPTVDAVAGRLGMAPGAKTYTTDEQLTEWNFSPIADPAQRADAMVRMFHEGRTDSEITDAIYPNRRRLITTGRPRIDEQVKFAREMNRLMQRKEAERLAQMPPIAGATAGTAPPPLGIVPTAEELPFAAPDAPLPPFQLTAPTPAPAPAQPSMLDMPAMPMMGG